MEKLELYLDDLENRIDEEEEARLYQEWKLFAENITEGNKNKKEPLSIEPRIPKPSSIKWPDININDALKDEELMILKEFKSCSDALSYAGKGLMQVRSNYGVGIIPTIFGAEIYVMPYEMNTLPNVRSLTNPEEAINKIVESPFPGLENGFGKNVFSVGEKYKKIKEKYKKISKWVRIDHPDCQGPMDLCELMWGSEIFYAFYDNDELMHKFLQKLTDFYIYFLDNWFSLITNPDSYHCYFGRMHKGSICIRNDSAMNLSPELYKEFIFPYDQQILKHFKGAIHFCGRGDHFIPFMSETEFLYAIDLSQPHLNDMGIILSNTVDKGINLHTVKFPVSAGHNLTRLSIV